MSKISQQKKSALNKFALLIFLITCVSNLNAQNFHTHTFNEEDGLPQPYVYSIIQDNMGYLWVGTGNGLSRYDGLSFKTFTTQDSLADNFITCSLTGLNGVWFGHINGDITYYSNNTFHPFLLKSSDKAMITDIEKETEEIFWASSYTGRFFLINKKFEIDSLVTAQEEPAPVINTFKVLNKSEVLIGASDGVYIFNYDKPLHKIQLKEKIKSIPESKITDIIEIEEQKKYLVACQDEGLYLIEFQKGNTVTRITFNEPVGGVQKILLSEDSSLWIGTFGNGLIRAEKINNGNYNIIQHLKEEKGFPSNYVKTLFTDREGIIWSGNYGGGLTQIVEKYYAYRKFDKNSTGNNILSIGSSQNFRWLGTENGLIKINRKTEEVIAFYHQPHGIPQDKITAILALDSFIWIGTGQSGIFHFNTKSETAKNYEIHQGNLENSITAIDGNENEIWIGTRKGLCNINLITDSIRWFTIQQGGLPNNSVNHVLLDSKNRLWVTTTGNTISIVEGQTIQKISIPTNNGNFNLNAITEDKDGDIWVGTMGNGLYLIEEDKLININTKQGLFSDFCYSISHTKNSLWVGHRGGISKVNTDELYVRSFQEKLEIKKDFEFNKHAIETDNNETVWMGSNQGLFSINDGEGKKQAVEPIVNIRSVEVNDEEVDIKEKLVLPPGRYKISIEYIGINLKEPEVTRYHFILKGYDDNASETAETRIVFPRLSSGNYRFMVSAINGDGISSKTPAGFSIKIKITVWKQPWFYVLLIALIFILIILWINRQKKKVRLENIILENKVKERTLEITAQKEEIKKQHDIVNKKNKNITDSINYARRIQTAMLPTHEYVKEFLPDSFIIYYPRDIVSGDFYWVSEIRDKTIFAVGDCTGHGVPGAFMSMLGITLLNDIVNNNKITSSDIILSRMRKSIIQLLKQKLSYDQPLDGIDMGLCVLDRAKMKLEFAGAGHPLIIIRDGEVSRIKPDRITLGISHFNEETFTCHELELKKGDMLYMCSDGFVDQIGGEKSKKFMAKRLLSILSEIWELPLEAQQENLKKAFLDWKGNDGQTDDTTLMGVRI